MNHELRNALRDAGLSQSGFARTLVAWGDPRPFEVLLRWVQRAVAGEEISPHISFVLARLHEHIKSRNLARRTLRLLESGGMRSGQDIGLGWEDTTPQSIAEQKRQLGVLDKLLAECNLDDPTPIISVDDLDPVTVSRFLRIYVVLPDRQNSFLIWDSHRLPGFVAPDVEVASTQDAMIEVTSLDQAQLKPIYDRLTEAGVGRGIVRTVVG